MYGYSDSDWAADRDDRKSIGAYIFLLASGPIAWSSRKQHVVSLSSTEAEYMSLSQAAAQATWIRSLLKEVGFGQEQGTILYGDNKGSVDIANNPIIGRGTKHIDVRSHYIRQCVQDNSILLHRLPSSSIVADTLTKPLAFPAFQSHRISMGLTDVYTQ